MYYNPLFPIALIFGVLLFALGRVVSSRLTASKWWGLVLAIAILLSLPGLSFFVYYLHLFDDQLWYIQFRSLPGIELLAMAWGFLFGFLPVPTKSIPLFFLRSMRWGYLCLSICLLSVPFIKPILLPLDYPALDANKWKDGVCLQYTGSTCGPASLATVLNTLGISRTEKEIARACYTSSSGTEIWYLIRYARAQGCTVMLLQQPDIARIPTPAIIGTNYGPIGHFVTILGRKDDKYIIGDPLIGKLLLTKGQFAERCGFKGFAVHIKARR